MEHDRNRYQVSPRMKNDGVEYGYNDDWRGYQDMKSPLNDRGVVGADVLDSYYQDQFDSRPPYMGSENHWAQLIDLFPTEEKVEQIPFKNDDDFKPHARRPIADSFTKFPPSPYGGPPPMYSPLAKKAPPPNPGGRAAYDAKVPSTRGIAGRGGVQHILEVAPGVAMTLRGAEETYAAIAKNAFMPAYCSCCRVTIFCIRDASFVLCPHCRVVSPMPEGDTNSQEHDGGVGLGFTVSELVKCHGDK